MIDFDIREALCAVIDSRHEKVRIMDELVIGKARADIVTVTDRLTGYEIKGDTDSYVRLPAQVREYDRYFQQNCLVIGASHLKSAAEHVPAHWGIWCVCESESGAQVQRLREPAANPKFSIKKQLGLLWQTELGTLLQENRLMKCAGKSKSYKRDYLLAHVPQAILARQVCEVLFERDWTVWD